MQDYQIVVRTLGPVTNVEAGVQNYSEFRSQLQVSYIEQGYEILSINVLDKKPDLGADVYTFAYHLVKEVIKDAKAKTDK